MNQRKTFGITAIVLWFALCGHYAAAVPSTVEQLGDEVTVVRDDAGNWSDGSLGITHQRGDKYTAGKLLDASGVPESVWKAAREVRLAIFGCVRDYSWHDRKETNGLDETLDITVNGKTHLLPDRSGLPQYVEGKSMSSFMRWHDLVLPKDDFVRGENRIELRMALPENKKQSADDYLYLGIDNTVATRNSHLRLDPKAAWRQDRINSVGAQGEYMVRLYVLQGDRQMTATWRPDRAAPDDPQRLLDYAGAADGTPRLEWNPQRLDAIAPIIAAMESVGGAPIELQWLDEEGKKLGAPRKLKGPKCETRLAPPYVRMPGGVQLAGSDALRSVTIRAGKGYRPVPQPVDMAPAITAPAGKPAQRKPTCRIEADKILISNANLRCEFRSEKGRLTLASLYNELACVEMVRQPEQSALGLVEVGGKRYALSRDFVCQSVKPLANQAGFCTELLCEAAGLDATLSVRIDDALRWNCSVTNRSAGPLDFKLAFVHLAGLAVSDQPADDYYFYPLSCLVSNAPALIRQGYGDHQALYQLMDIFSPDRGAGLAVWCSDDDGRYKVLALRKHVHGQATTMVDSPRSPTADEFKWTNSLEAVPGVSMAYEYLRRTRGPGESLAPSEVAMQAHVGDWHAAMRNYANRLHRTWKFRPYPSKLTPVTNMLAAGWAQGPLFRDGKYRTDFIKPATDCVELMSWWEWSELGPWRTPWDKLEARLGPAVYKRYSPYFVTDPVTGKTMYPLSRGDYDGYNQRWGGLPTLREAIATYKKLGSLTTLYTDPLLADDNTRCGQKWGELWGIVTPEGKYRTNYEAWNMCHDVAEYRRFVADAMGRVMRETGADGIRLDEYGHAGAACFNKRHKHTFAEWGCTEWQRAIAETTKMVRAAMDEAAPGSVLTTEHPGYDYLMPFLEGCITYDLTVLSSPLRPLECNLQRFFFPECKAYELDHRGADRQHCKRFWNAVGSFGSYYPKDMYAILQENAEVFASRDAEPLVPTLVPQVYANRFRAGEKTLFTVYNATGHSIHAALLPLAPRPGERVVELRTGRALEEDAKLFLGRGDVACVAFLPVRLTVKAEKETWTVSVKKPKPSWQVVVCDRDAAPLVTRSMGDGRLTIRTADVPKGAAAASIKLLDEGRLVDICPTP